MHVEQFLNFFSENNSMETTEVVVTDKAVAEMNAVQKCWPNCRPLICHFHIMSSLNHFVRSCEFSAEDRKQCSKVRTLVNIIACYSTVVHSYSDYLNPVYTINRFDNRVERTAVR